MGKLLRRMQMGRSISFPHVNHTWIDSSVQQIMSLITQKPKSDQHLDRFLEVASDGKVRNNT